MSEDLKKSVTEVKELLELTKNGKPFSTIDNAAIIFREDPILGGNLKNNLFRERIELTGRMPCSSICSLTMLCRTGIEASIASMRRLLRSSPR